MKYKLATRAINYGFTTLKHKMPKEITFEKNSFIISISDFELNIPYIESKNISFEFINPYTLNLSVSNKEIFVKFRILIKNSLVYEFAVLDRIITVYDIDLSAKVEITKKFKGSLKDKIINITVTNFSFGNNYNFKLNGLMGKSAEIPGFKSIIKWGIEEKIYNGIIESINYIADKKINEKRVIDVLLYLLIILLIISSGIALLQILKQAIKFIFVLFTIIFLLYILGFINLE